MGRIEADIALESWLFGFRPCSGHEQFTLFTVPHSLNGHLEVNSPCMVNIHR